MRVGEIMNRYVEVIDAQATIREAAGKMRQFDVGSLPVREGDEVIGMLTDRDIVVRGVADGLDSNQSAVRELVSPEIAYCFEEDDVKKAAELMEQRQIRRLLVVNQAKDIVGIVSLGDLAVEANDELAGQVLERVAEPAKPEQPSLRVRDAASDQRPPAQAR